MFIDHSKIHVKAGDGGAGALSFHTEKYITNGGPDGGDGGNGGNIVFESSSRLTSLQNFRFKQAPRPDQYILLDSDPKLFYLFFPSDIHECCGIARKAETVRKIVVKIDYFE